MKRTKAELCDIVRPVAHERGYVLDDAVFTRNKEFNLSWLLRDRNITVRISDYVDEAPDEVVRQAAEICFDHISRRKPVYGDVFLSYMRSDEFVLLKRPTYVRRARNLTMSTVGQTRDLVDSVQRLLDTGLLRDSDIDNSVFTWTKTPNYTRMGYCSTMMKVVAVSSILDDERYSDNVVDEVVYHECLHLRQGYRPFDRNPHDAAFRRQMKLFPGLDAAEAELRAIPRPSRPRVRRSR